MTPEQSAHSAIRRSLAGRAFVQRIEKNVDVPDIYMKLGDLQLWIELKAAKDNEALKLRPGQINWITKHGAGAMLLIRQLTNDGRHRQWVALDHLGVALLRHLRRPTPDIVVASLSCRVSEGDLEGLLHETGRET